MDFYLHRLHGLPGWVGVHTVGHDAVAPRGAREDQLQNQPNATEISIYAEMAE